MIKLDRNNYESTLQDNAYIQDTDKPLLDRQSSHPEANGAIKERLNEYLFEVSVKYGQDYQKMHNVIMCESSFRTDVYSKGKVSYGIAQFTQDTWIENCSSLNYYNPYSQLDCMGSMWARNKGLQYRWDCTKILG